MKNPTAADMIEHVLSLIAMADVERPEKATQIRRDLDLWQHRSPAHKSAYDEALRRWHALGHALPEVRARLDEPKTRARKVGARRVLCVAAIVAVAAMAFHWYFRQPIFEQAYRTGTGQIGKIALPDGSRIDLNAQTVLEVRLYRDRRIIALKSGEARFEVASDANNPFQVYTRAGVVEVIGTVFTVSDRGPRVVIDIDQGRVRFFRNGESAAVELKAGQRLVARQNTPTRIEPDVAAPRAEWREGWLVFNNEPLADALLAINTFREAPIRLADDKAGLLRLTGRFRASDSRSLLEALPKILPVTVTQKPDGSVEIRRR